MTTNEVKALQPGDAAYAFFLSAQGRVLADVYLLCREEDILLDTEPETRAKIYEHLDRFIIADDAALEDFTEQTATIALEGPLAGAVLAKCGAALPDAGHARWGDRLVARISLAGDGGCLILAPLAEKETLIAELESAGATEADSEAFRIVRLENGKPRYGEEISDRYLTQETGQMQAVSFSKGCYLGQEIVERVRARAQIHRRLLPLEIATSTPPPAGTKFEAEGKHAAEIASAAYSPALGKTVGLAYVRIDFKPGDVITADGVEAKILAAPPEPNPESAQTR
jgi:aminomethyltransferase